MWFHCIVFLLLLQLPPLASAHTTGVSFADFEIRDREIELRLQINLRELQFARRLDSNGDQLIAEAEVQRELPRFLPELVKHCCIWTEAERGQATLAGVGFRPERGELECRLVYSFRQPLDDLKINMALHHVTDSGHWNLAQIRYDGVVEQRYFNLESPEARIELRRTWTSYFQLAGRFLVLSLKGVLARLEMAGFVAGLVLIAKCLRGFLLPPLVFFFAQLAGFIAATYFHSLLPQRFIASALALSMVYVAAENLLLKQIGYRSLIAALFGLIYGCSFGAITAEAVLPQKGLVTALVSYELGIGLVVAGVVVLVLVATRYLIEQRQALVLGSWLCLAGGTIEFVRRTF